MLKTTYENRDVSKFKVFRQSCFKVHSTICRIIKSSRYVIEGRFVKIACAVIQKAVSDFVNGLH